LRTRFGINKACVVADRGMISAATIAALGRHNIDYILGARERSKTEIRKTVLEDDGVAVPLLIPRQKGAALTACLHRAPTAKCQLYRLRCVT
jgi:hypothetical protein